MEIISIIKNPKTKKWIQEDSAHSSAGGITNQQHLEIDTKGNSMF